LPTSISRAKYFGPETSKIGTKMWKFKDYYVGTFCFDYSERFGCGDDLGLEQMQKIVVDSVLDTETFKTKFGANFE